MAEGRIEELVSESLMMAVVKKNILDIILHTLKRENIEANRQLIMELIDEIPIREFRKLANSSRSKSNYSSHVEEVVKSVFRKYLKVARAMNI